jgi:hypothetical protein
MIIEGAGLSAVYPAGENLGERSIMLIGSDVVIPKDFVCVTALSGEWPFVQYALLPSSDEFLVYMELSSSAPESLILAGKPAGTVCGCGKYEAIPCGSINDDPLKLITPP